MRSSQFRRARAKRSAQVASFDIIISMVALLIFIGIIAVFVTLYTKPDRARTIYGGQVFDNLMNMKNTPGLELEAFLSDYTVDQARLEEFSTISAENIEKIVFQGSDEYSPGIADLCIFFLDYGLVDEISPGIGSVGEVYQDAGHSARGGCDLTDPCRHYRRTYAHVLPVNRDGRVMSMYVVVCKA